MDIRRILSRLLALAVVVAGTCHAVLPAWGEGWQVIKVHDRDYLSLQNIADFYQLSGEVSPARGAKISNARASLEYSGNPREISINGIRNFLSFPVVIQDGQVLISRFDLARTVEPGLRPTMIGNLNPFRTVVLDAGHGGNDMGASSLSGCEKDYALDVALNLRKALEREGFKVILTRRGDAYLPLEQRAQQANNVSEAIFVSVHFNSEAVGIKANGVEVYAMTPRGAASTGDGVLSAEQFKEMPGNEFDNASFALATCVQHAVLGQTPQEDRGVRRARFAVLRLTRMPAILIEGGFLTNVPESQQINDPVWRARLADSVVRGVVSFRELAEHKHTPKLLADYRSENLPANGTIVDAAALAASAVRHATDLTPTSNSQPVVLLEAPKQVQAIH